MLGKGRQNAGWNLLPAFCKADCGTGGRCVPLESRPMIAVAGSRYRGRLKSATAAVRPIW